jgi:hypothetical protein
MSKIEDVLAMAREAPAGELPALIGALEAAKAEAWGRLTSPPAPPPPAAPVASDRLLTPEEAARIAGILRRDGKPAVRRLYEWARGQAWARRPTKRCLRISEAGFRRWLASRG